METFSTAKSILEKYHQEHLLNFYDELDDSEKSLLINQICNINFEQIFNLYEASKLDDCVPNNLIEPLPYTDKANLSKNDIDCYKDIGSNIIKSNEYAVVTMAGGQGTRLGYSGPKGTFELDIKPKKSLFEILCDNLKEANEKYNVVIPWYIMTSIYNDNQTKDFFKEKNYFGYPKDSIKFFKQSQLPLIDIYGNLILEEPYKIKEASNGNGNVFHAMKKSKIIDDMKSKGIKWVFFAGVDNVLLRTADTLFLGLSIKNNCLVASKTLFKEDVNAKDWVFARKNGKPSIINTYNFTDTMKNARDENGNFLYRDVNMLAHLFNISALEILCDKNLPYHRAFKKNTFVNDEGMKQVPEVPNTFKFETFIFDAFSSFDKIQLLRVNKFQEFSPIKDFNGTYNPEIAKKMYEYQMKNKK